MALIACPACNTAVSDQATACPQCGHPFASARKSGGGVAQRCAIAFAVAIGLVVLLFLIGSLYKPGPYKPTDADANMMCEKFVRDRLKAPSTAKFAGYASSRIRQAGLRYTVSSHVDAENGFGANIRTTFTCVVQPTTGGKWDLVSLDMLP